MIMSWFENLIIVLSGIVETPAEDVMFGAVGTACETGIAVKCTADGWSGLSDCVRLRFCGGDKPDLFFANWGSFSGS